MANVAAAGSRKTANGFVKHELLERLRCPLSGGRLRLEATVEEGGEVRSGTLVSADETCRYPIVEYVPRFVEDDNYASNFGFQWTRFRRTQLDSHSGVPVSRERFYRFSGWNPGMLEGRWVLDVGCGAGRFTEIALDAGARVVAVDYSAAADACWDNHRGHPGLDVLQADIYRLPFVLGKFDFVYCFGVLQHTPDVRAAFLSLPPQLRPGGRLAVDLYPRLRRNIIWPKYWLRPVTARVRPERLLRVVEALVPRLLPVSDLLGRVPGVGHNLRYAIPVMNYRGVFPLTGEQLREWAVLDTFDMLSARHDKPQTAESLRRWCEEAGLQEVWVGRRGFLIGRGRRSEDGQGHT